MPRVLIFDPNSQNPYSLELARCLAGAHEVSLFAATEGARRVEGCRVASLPGCRPPGLDVRVLGWAWNRFWRPLAVAMSALRHRDSEVIVVWVSDPWQALVLGALGIRRRVHWINHNPPGTRVGYRDVDFLSLLRRTAASRPVHSSRLRDRTVPMEHQPVVAHPSFRAIAGGRRWRQPAHGSSERRTLAYIGALRHDKGADELPMILQSLGPAYEVKLLGPAAVPAPLESMGEGEVRASVTSAGPRPLTDAQLVDELLKSDSVIAPYVQATQSGSLVLAMTVGIPAVAYNVGALSELLRDSALTPVDPRALAQLIKEGAPEDCWLTTPELLDRACAEDWSAVLGH